MGYNKNLQLGREEIKARIKLADRCGLIFTGDFEEEQPQFLGDDRAWGLFSNLLENI